MAESAGEVQVKIIQAVGQCIMRWAVVEQHMTYLYCESVRSPIGMPAAWLNACVFDSVVSIDARLDMIEAALNFHINFARQRAPEKAAAEEPLLDEWKRVRAKIRKFYNRRNEVAHSVTTSAGLSKEGIMQVRLMPFPVISAGVYSPPAKLLTVHDLERRVNLFDALGNRIAQFRDHVRASLGRLPIAP